MTQIDALHPIEHSVRLTMERQGLTVDPCNMVVAVSGGPNSIALLHALWKLSEKLHISLHVAHLNHSIRGHEASLDAELVRNFCRTLAIPCTIAKIDLHNFRKKQKISSIEEAARELRYDFLAKVARKRNYSIIATGHTADDQAETILMHLLRGSGLTGLSGMKEFTNEITKGFPPELSVLRPILAIRHSETLAYCKENFLSYRIDSTNRSNAFTRNIVRNKLIPLLSQFNPQIQLAINQLGSTAAESIDYMESVAQATLDELVRFEQDSIIMPANELIATHRAVRHLVFQLAIRKLTGNNRFIPKDKILRMDQLLFGNLGPSFQLSKLIMICLTRDSLAILRIGPNTNKLPRIQSETPITIPGTNCLSTGTLTSNVNPHPWKIEKPNAHSVYFDKETIGSDFILRSWKAGDQFQPFGMIHRKKLQDFFVDMKIARHLRNEIPLLVSNKGILWVVGYRRSDLGKVIPSSKQIVKIEWLPHDANSAGM